MYFSAVVEVSTSSEECQQWINRGAVQMFGFNPEEAIRCFRKALYFSPDCAMAHYFIAHCCAPNYNDASGLDCSQGLKEAQMALETASQAPAGLKDWESAMIKAKPHQFTDEESGDSVSRSYCNAMRPVYEKFGEENTLVAAVFAESLMMLAPWTLWTSQPDVKPAIPETEELVRVLEKGLEKDHTHPALCHFYIHTMELSASPEKALPAANVLRSRTPDQGHLLHMPSHIDMWVGQYKEAVEINKLAVVADEKYLRITGHENEMYKMYRLHNYHFTVWAAMFDGPFSIAVEYAEAACRQLDLKAVQFVLGDIPVGSMFFEAFGMLPWHVLVRFGKWKEILARPLKDDADMYPGTTAMSHYARGVACAVLGQLEEADKECENFRNTLKNKKITNCYLFNNVVHDPEKKSGVLDVAEAVLYGEVEYFKGNKKEAFEHLRLAVQRDNSLVYDEPWGWMMPARHVLGALLLEEGELEEAERVYRQDLQQYKENLWSLLGLQQVLARQNRTQEAAATRAAFLRASARADIKIGASCFCATKLCCQ